MATEHYKLVKLAGSGGRVDARLWLHVEGGTHAASAEAAGRGAGASGAGGAEGEGAGEGAGAREGGVFLEVERLELQLRDLRLERAGETDAKPTRNRL